MHPDIDSLPANVLAALARGHTVEAIKLLRESTGLGLKEAKEAIDRHVAGRPAGVATAIPPTHVSPASLPPAVVAALQQGNKIEAIRLLREKTGLGLKDAKDAVESFRGPSTTAAGLRAPGEVPRSTRGAWLLAALAAIAAVGYFLFSRSG